MEFGRKAQLVSDCPQLASPRAVDHQPIEGQGTEVQGEKAGCDCLAIPLKARLLAEPETTIHLLPVETGYEDRGVSVA